MPKEIETEENRYAQITVPLIPVSVNHYWKFKIVRGQVWVEVTPGAKAFMDAIGYCKKGQRVVGEELVLTFRVYLGKGNKGDTGNFEKGIGDGLVKCGVIKTDAAIVEIHQYKFRDWDNPRTEIEIARK